MYDINGRPEVTGVKREKGIDVLCALALVREARADDIDLVILASADTDLTPALDEAVRLRSAKIETVRWFNKDVPSTRGVHRTEHRIWNTRLGEDRFRKSIDRASY